MLRGRLEKNLLTVSITRVSISDLLTVKPSDYWNRKHRLEMILTGKIVETPIKPQGSRARKMIIIDQHVIQIHLARIHDRINNPGMKESRKRIPYYRRIMHEYAQKCMAEGKLQVDGVMCHHCAKVITEGSDALSMAKNNGRKYFHPWCAEALHLL